jgi:hypothetical protein
MRGLSIVINKALAPDLPSGSPIEAPVRTVTRAFLKGGDKPQEYYQKTSDLKDSIEAETKPHPVYSLGLWTQLPRDSMSG